VALPPLTRASALRGGLVALGGAVVGFVVARASGLADTSSSGAANSYGADPAGGGRLAALADIPEGGGIVLNEQRVVLVRGEGDEVHAFSAACTHQGCPVSEVTDGQIICPCHGSVFDAETGDVLDGPAPSPLEPVEVVVEGGNVMAE
jgi:nitrite reductase/ring-hydroxylating ferredoxin subunit